MLNPNGTYDGVRESKLMGTKSLPFGRCDSNWILEDVKGQRLFLWLF